MPDPLKTLEHMAAAALASEPLPTPERIREIISALCRLPMCAIDHETAEMLARQFEQRLGVTMTLGALLTEGEFEPWLDAAKANIDPYYWERYHKLLIAKQFSSDVRTTLDAVTNRILGQLENPQKGGKWDRRGMVVGDVQSGKTANYIGLICKAADAGYKLIVVIAGIHSNLRNQTQIRIDEGFIGRDSARLLSQKVDPLIGVGKFDQTRRPTTFTNSVKDFNKSIATAVGVPLDNLKEPAVLVIKKNANTLKNVLEWLQEHSAKGGIKSISAPMLVIDDEADNASINISHETGGVSTINGQIRQLLKLFDRSCYVGYTATPFANIFIDPDTDDQMKGADLFPRHFIVSLDPPSNYFGARQVFLHEIGKFIRHVEDNEPWLPMKHVKNHVVSELPGSLVDAVRLFILARAIRLCRGHQDAHSSMLVNVSRFTSIHGQVRNLLHDRLSRIQAAVRLNGALPVSQAIKDPEIEKLYTLWKKEYEPAVAFPWSQVQDKLHDAAAPISVVEINSRSSGSLNYENPGLSVIAVGGFSLSRGLTLEGLTISYFLRNSMMYDTLMQMGRWFGYRDGYEELCRIWMPEEAEGWYTHIAESIEMLREEFRTMEAAGATPGEFGLKVRSHPDTLVVTARNKMGSSEPVVVSIGLGNNFVETAILRRDEDSLAANLRAAQELLTDLEERGIGMKLARRVQHGWLISNVPVAPVLDFVSKFRNHEGSMLTDGNPVRRYVEDRYSDGLATWDLLVPSVRDDKSTLRHDLRGLEVNCPRRTAGKKSNATTLHITNKQRVASRGVEKTGLTELQITEAEEEYRNSLVEKAKDISYPDWIYRRKRARPLLILHLLRIDSEPGEPAHSEPVVAWSISFPKPEKEEKRVEYLVNTPWLREYYKDELEDEEMGGD